MREILAHAQINLFADTYTTEPMGIITLAEALEAIRSEVHADRIAYVRRMRRRGEASYRAAKNRLPAYTFAGTFAPSRKIEYLQQHSGIVHGDLDHLTDVAAVKRTMAADPCTVYAFVSPSGEGLKLGVHVPVVPDDRYYKHAWQTVAQRYGGTWDPSGKDICRLCYVSHDPDAYMNFNADLFALPPLPPPARTPDDPSTADAFTEASDPQDDVERAIRTAQLMIISAVPGTRHHARFRAARLLGGYVGGGLLPYERALKALSDALEGHTDDMAGALKTVVDGLRYGEAAPITRETIAAKRHPSPTQEDRWGGASTLPIRPFARRGGIRIRGKQVRHG